MAIFCQIIIMQIVKVVKVITDVGENVINLFELNFGHFFTLLLIMISL